MRCQRKAAFHRTSPARCAGRATPAGHSSPPSQAERGRPASRRSRGPRRRLAISPWHRPPARLDPHLDGPMQRVTTGSCCRVDRPARRGLISLMVPNPTRKSSPHAFCTPKSTARSAKGKPMSEPTPVNRRCALWFSTSLPGRKGQGSVHPHHPHARAKPRFGRLAWPISSKHAADVWLTSQSAPA